jgi:hypothetical protein
LLPWNGCAATNTSAFNDDDGAATNGPGPGSGGSGGSISTGDGGFSFGGGSQGGNSGCAVTCSADFHQVVDCNGIVLEQCSGLEGCDASLGTCTNACAAAVNNKQSVGCEYYATDMETYSVNYCFAAFVANTWNTPVHLNVQFNGATLPVENFTRIPIGQGPTLTYQIYDNTAGLAPGEVAIMFLSGITGGAPNCPVSTAATAGITGTGVSPSFKVSTDVPVVMYQINPYGGGSTAVTGASLLLPTSAWDTNYIAVNAYRSGPHPASLNIVAKEDNTQITMLPIANVVGGGGIPPGSANGQMFFSLNAGEHAQLTQLDELTGSVIESDKPVGLMAGARCSYVPQGVYACDHLEQMIPPVKALGHEHVGVMHQSRSGEPGVWRLIGAVDGTELSWSADIGGPTTLDQGEVAELSTQFAFTVKSQDADHPFILMSHMSGGSTNGMNGVGDADAVLAVPPAQWLKSYVFFADPTYPRTNLVVIRAHGKDGPFVDVHSECGGPLTGWQDVGDYQYTRVDLTNGNFQDVGGCSSGRQRMFSNAPFGVYVWGWGSPTTTPNTEYVSYGYPAGMNVGLINNLNIPPTPK